ncbi:MAG TPA: hypothetical protein DIW17_00610, partial [Clostridiales bacterium]|nr:hypothetical protein [Clostridiales bacterium]
DADSVQGIIVYNKSGKGFISGKVYIDATGDGDVSYLAKADYMTGDENQKNQAVSLRYIIGGINVEEFWNYLNRYQTEMQR